jgi:hypothetical protein
MVLYRRLRVSTVGVRGGAPNERLRCGAQKSSPWPSPVLETPPRRVSCLEDSPWSSPVSETPPTLQSAGRSVSEMHAIMPIRLVIPKSAKTGRCLAEAARIRAQRPHRAVSCFRDATTAISEELHGAVSCFRDATTAIFESCTGRLLFQRRHHGDFRCSGLTRNGDSRQRLGVSFADSPLVLDSSSCGATIGYQRSGEVEVPTIPVWGGAPETERYAERLLQGGPGGWSSVKGYRRWQQEAFDKIDARCGDWKSGKGICGDDIVPWRCDGRHPQRRQNKVNGRYPGRERGCWETGAISKIDAYLNRETSAKSKLQPTTW